MATRPVQSKTCPRCKGRGYLPRLTAARSDGACVACAGAGWVLIGGALRDFELKAMEKWLAELLSTGANLAERKAAAQDPASWADSWYDHDERQLIGIRARYRAVRKAINALRVLPDNATMGAIRSAAELANA